MPSKASKYKYRKPPLRAGKEGKVGGVKKLNAEVHAPPKQRTAQF